MKTNYHTHCNFCDGKGKPEIYVIEAIKCGFTSLGFSSHAPLKEENVWTLTDENIVDYFNTIRRLKTKYQDKINIHVGLEIDYYPDENRFQFFEKFNPEFSIGSVHMIKKKGSEKYYSVDNTPEEFDYMCRSVFGSAKAVVKEYYKTLGELIIQGGFSILGHLDLVRKFNEDNKFFDEDSTWYHNEVIKILDLLSKSNCIVEVNTGAISRGYQKNPYPSSWILKECKSRDIKICLNSDVHGVENLECYFPEAVVLIKSCGYTTLHTPFEVIDL